MKRPRETQYKQRIGSFEKYPSYLGDSKKNQFYKLFNVKLCIFVCGHGATTIINIFNLDSEYKGFYQIKTSRLLMGKIGHAVVNFKKNKAVDHTRVHIFLIEPIRCGDHLLLINGRHLVLLRF